MAASLEEQLKKMHLDDYEDEFAKKKIQPKMKEEYALYDYQSTVINWMKAREQNIFNGIRGGLVCLMMGLGKTLIALQHTNSSQIENNEEYPTLVVISKTLLYEWKKEGVNKFFDNMKILCYHKEFIGKNKFEKITTEKLKKYNIVFTTYDMCLVLYKRFGMEDSICIKGDHGIHKDKIILVKKRDRPKDTLVIGPKAIYYLPWERIICDESQRFANPKTQTFRAMMAIYAKYRWCLTGTPIRNYDTDIWAQLRFCGFDPIVQSRKWKYHKFDMYNCKNHLYVLNYKEANVDMPKLIDKVCEIDMDKNQRFVYNTILKKMENLLSNYFTTRGISYMCILAMFTRLRQVCLSPHLLVSKKTSSKEIKKVIGDILSQEDIDNWMKDVTGTSGMYSPKMNTVIDIVSEIKTYEKELEEGEENKEKTIVKCKRYKKEKFLLFSMFSSALEVLEERFDKEGIPCFVMTGSTSMKERYNMLKVFKQTNACNVMLIHYKVGGEGINLTEAENIILFETWWTHAVHNQGIHRSWRRGQDKDVTVYWLLCKKSIELRIMEMCDSKQRMSDSYLGEFNRYNERSGLDINGMMDIIMSRD